MREATFIQQNKDRWESYSLPTDDPDELAKRFAMLVDDLAYAKAHYPYSNLVSYINAKAAAQYLSIYKNKKSEKSLKAFWMEEVPLVLYKNRKTLLYAFLFFALFLGIGLFSAWQDPAFIRGILGGQYVDMTENNIARGNPFGVYKEMDATAMFLTIAFNNIKVAFLCFASGILLSIGTVAILLQNGLMVGAFEYMFIAHNLGAESICVVFVHGTLELSAIVVSGCAGLTMGNAILFPGTYTRMQSFKRGARDGIKIMLTLVPIFLVAAIFESYVTRYTNMPIWISISILILSLTFMIWYYVWLPSQVFRKRFGKAKRFPLAYLLEAQKPSNL